MEFNDLQQTRIAKLQPLRDAGLEPFPLRTERTITNAEAVAEFAQREGETHTVVGRIVAKRDVGRVAFLVIRDGTGEIQLFLQQRKLGQNDMKP